MTQNDPSHPVSPQLKRLQTPEQSGIRNTLRFVGPVVLAAGLLCCIIAAVNFFAAFGGDGPPRLFWLAFIGIPVIFVGVVMCQFGYMGAVARYVAGESAPVAADTVNYLADETQGAVETVAKSAAKGIVEGIEEAKSAANFCPHCGTAVKADFIFCPKCGKSITAA